MDLDIRIRSRSEGREKMRLRNLNEKYPFQRFAFLRAAGRMAVLAWIFVAGLALAVPECRASAENNDSLPKWEEVIDKLMEETAWTSIDGKTNYMEMASLDMDLYQDTYNLEPWGEPTDESILYHLDGYPVTGKATGMGYIQFFAFDDEMARNHVNLGLWLDREEIKKLRTWLCIGLYPDLCGIRLGDGYEEVCQILGIEEEMLNSLPDNFSGSSGLQHIEKISWDEYDVYGITYSEDGGESLNFVKGDKEIMLSFKGPEDAPAGEADLFLKYIQLNKD